MDDQRQGWRIIELAHFIQIGKNNDGPELPCNYYSGCIKSVQQLMLEKRMGYMRLKAVLLLLIQEQENLKHVQP